MIPTRPSQHEMQPDETPPIWWVWFDRLLDEWFYTPINPEDTPNLAVQLQKEKVIIHEVKAFSGAQAIEKISPGYRDARRQDPISAPISPSRRLN